MGRWEQAQRAEVEWVKKHGGLSEVSVPDPSAEYGPLGLDPASVEGIVIDIGGAHGAYCVPFVKASRRVVVDPLYHGYSARFPGIEGIPSGGEALPFGTATIDFVILRNVIDHTLEPKRIVQEAARVLRNGGSLYFMVNMFPVLLRPLFPLMNRLDGPHPVHLTKSMARAMLTDSGLTIIRERTCGSGTPTFRLRRFAGWLIKREYHAILRK